MKSKMSDIILYHGTAASNNASILSDGLKPRQDKDSNEWTMGAKSNKDCVYFCTHPQMADFYGFRASLMKGENKYSVFKIPLNKLDEQKILPDENYIVNKTYFRQISADEYNQIASTLDEYKPQWKKSLQEYNLIAYKDTVKDLEAATDIPLTDSKYYHKKIVDSFQTPRLRMKYFDAVRYLVEKKFGGTRHEWKERVEYFSDDDIIREMIKPYRELSIEVYDAIKKERPDFFDLQKN